MAIYNVNGIEIPTGGEAVEDYGRFIRSINHRGYQTVAPENTIPAFQLSKQMGFDCVESDVRFTSDNVPVMLHNADINNTARNPDGTEISTPINISSITYEQALEYDFGIKKSITYAGTKIPTFYEFLSLCKNIGLHPYIELKTGSQSKIEGIVDIVYSYGMEHDVTFASSYQYLLNYVAEYDDICELDWFVNSISASDITYASSLLNGKRTVIIGTGLSDSDETLQSAVDAGIVLNCGLISNVNQAKNLHKSMRGAMSNSILTGKVLYDNNIS